jgi:hypothetical protein
VHVDPERDFTTKCTSIQSGSTWSTCRVFIFTD